MVGTYYFQNEVMRLYEKLQGQLDSFKSASGLSCPLGCGRCCENPDIFVNVLEVLPLAYHLWQNKTAQVVLDKMSALSSPGVCVFYKPDALNPGHGRCGVYPWRPLICRLFGYSVKKNKYGQPRLVTCLTMKTECAKEYQQAEQNLAGGTITAPVMHDFAMQLCNIDPHLGKEYFPINKAIEIAIQKTGLFNAD